MSDRSRRVPADDATWRLAGEGARDLSLLVVGEGVHRVHALPPAGQVTLGRADLCDVVVAHPSVSRRHAAIVVGPGVTIEDLGSANGVFVRGQRLAAHVPTPIGPGDAIDLGSVTLVLQQRGAVASAAPREMGRPTAAPAAPASVGATALDAFLAKRAIVRDPAMRRLYELAARVAASPLSVLVTGETGAGKELVAEAIHRLSPRASGPYVAINCAALSPTLLESELFGHARGAFTGAHAAAPGLLAAADGGTVFLDEVGEMPAALQAKLLRVLEERAVRPVGAAQSLALDLRFVCATHRDLRAEVARGTFRQDLFYRLNGVSLEVPALRARPDDIDALAEHFAARAAAAVGQPPAPITASTRAQLRAYPWPGNVRELKNTIERAVVLAAGAAVEPAHLPPELTAAAPVTHAPPTPATPATPATAVTAGVGPGRGGDLREDLEAFERARILAALEQCAGNQTRAAELLGIPRRTLVTKLGALNIPRPRKRDGGE